MVRKIVILGFSVLAAIAAVAIWNYTTVHQPASQAVSSDPRNNGIEILVHYKWFIHPSILVFDLRSVSGSNSSADVTRSLLQSAGSLKRKEFEFVILSYKGNPKFMLKGDYFQTIGLEYGVQNPVYTLRTLPENVYTLEGKQAFGSWTGGWLGVVGKQMEDLNEFHRLWFMSDL